MTSLNKRWIPKSVLCLQAGYTRRDFIADLIAGVTVGLVALPLAMAFGIASGVTPQAGLYTAVVAGFFISALGGSRLQISGPTGAFVVIVARIIATHGVSGLLIVTLMAGVMLLSETQFDCTNHRSLGLAPIAREWAQRYCLSYFPLLESG